MILARKEFEIVDLGECRLKWFFCELTTYFYRILLAKNIDFFKETSVYFPKLSPAALLIVDLCGSRLKWLFFELVRVWNFTIVDLSDSRLKVPQQTSSVFVRCSNLGYVVSSPHQKSEFGARGSQTLLETSKTVSRSPGKCTWPSVYSEVSNLKISYLERGGPKYTLAPPLLKISAEEL